MSYNYNNSLISMYYSFYNMYCDAILKMDIQEYYASAYLDHIL